MSDDTYYELLGVEPTASRDELRTAYRERVESLEAQREGKNVNESVLQANREETARVRSAWNVLSDPFQRQRYDQQLMAAAAGDVVDGDVVDGDEDATVTDSAGQEVELTGWRRILAPPPPKQPRNGSSPRAAGGRAAASNRPVKEPTIALPPGVTLAENRVRGMALLFDISILLLIYIGVQFFVPQLIQSDYKDITDQITACNKVNDDASPASKLTSEKKDCGYDESFVTQTRKQQEKAADKRATKLTEDVRTTQYITLAITLALIMLYLVPMTAKTGRTLGMRGRRIKVLRVTGEPAGWWPSFVRYFVPVALALAVPTLGPLLGFGVVGWGYMDANRQGVHDKLAKTIVVNA